MKQIEIISDWKVIQSRFNVSERFSEMMRQRLPTKGLDSLELFMKPDKKNQWLLRATSKSGKQFEEYVHEIKG